MGLTEAEVFEIVAEKLDDRDYDFFVHCDYESIRSKYGTHSKVIANGIPDIIGMAPDDSVIAIEVKGDTDIKKGRSQAIDYKAGSNASYLAADHSALDGRVSDIRTSGIGVISVSNEGIVDWQEPAQIENKTALPEIRAQLTARINGVGSFTEIASLNLAHPANFLAPAVFLEYHASYWGSIGKDDFIDQFREISLIQDGAFSSVVEGASVLNLIDYGSSIKLSDQGRVGLLVLQEQGVESLDDLESLIEFTSHGETLYTEAPLLATWLLDQYRKQPDFEALYRTLQSFEPGEKVPLTDLTARLIRDHPNTFLRLFCTNESRDRARKLLIEGRQSDIFEDLDTFRDLIRQNLIQNFVRQLQHIGVLSSQTASTTRPLDEYVPEEYPWILPSRGTQTRFGYF